jgi:hypothetical protein
LCPLLCEASSHAAGPIRLGRSGSPRQAAATSPEPAVSQEAGALVSRTATHVSWWRKNASGLGGSVPASERRLKVVLSSATRLRDLASAACRGPLSDDPSILQLTAGCGGRSMCVMPPVGILDGHSILAGHSPDLLLWVVQQQGSGFRPFPESVRVPRRDPKDHAQFSSPTERAGDCGSR